MRRRHQLLDFARTIHFVTTVTRVRGNWFTTDETRRELLELFEGYRAKFNVSCLGYVLMPDHLHALMFQETDGPWISKVMEGFKSVSSRRLIPHGYPDRHLWMERYDDVPLPGTRAVERRLHYMHFNPVERGMVAQPEDYDWSSYRDYAELGKGLVTLTLF